MKTNISIPDSIFEAAEQLAQELEMSRSELYTVAITAYVQEHREECVTEQLNQVYATEDSGLDEVVQQLQALSLPAEEW